MKYILVLLLLLVGCKEKVEVTQEGVSKWISIEGSVDIDSTLVSTTADSGIVRVTIIPTRVELSTKVFGYETNPSFFVTYADFKIYGKTISTCKDSITYDCEKVLKEGECENIIRIIPQYEIIHHKVCADYYSDTFPIDITDNENKYMLLSLAVQRIQEMIDHDEERFITITFINDKPVEFSFAPHNERE